jgi:copper chaperone NosL
MKRAPFLIVLLFVSACATTTPVPIRAGDICFHCRRTIADPALAAEVIAESQHAFKFASVGCLTEYLREHSSEDVRAIFVTDYTRGKMLPADDAYYVKMVVEPRTNAMDYAAFRSRENAVVFAQEHKQQVVEWEQVLGDQGTGHAGH